VEGEGADPGIVADETATGAAATSSGRDCARANAEGLVRSAAVDPARK